MSPVEAPTRHIRRAERRRRPTFAMRAVGFFGELLITLGVLLGLFVVWQVFWTDVQGARAAADNIQVFAEELPASPEQAGEPQTGAPPQEPTPGRGETFATMFVPRWGADWEFPIAEGVGTRDILNAGFVGHYPQTQLPGQIGNVAVAGHRQSHAAPFLHVDQLEVGDAIVVQTAQAWYVYRVTEWSIVQPSQVDVLSPVPGDPTAEADVATLTLTTCHPLWSTAERWIVHAELDNWVDRADGRPIELIEGQG